MIRPATLAAAGYTAVALGLFCLLAPWQPLAGVGLVGAGLLAVWRASTPGR